MGSFGEGLTSPEVEIAEGGAIVDSKTKMDKFSRKWLTVPQLKKLVFVYLVRYAEEQQDLALLSISTFQRALKDPNQLIRASALRVLSSIRVPMIAPIMLLAIRESESLQPELIECIDYLLGDKRTLVLGSAVYAFEETCPDRFDLLHRHYRALCKVR
ncbi:unnamed protein product [Gongylonema pulchrum]|uniref:Adaptin_N domain-containing protein n=1 Tax=Gongylonema pulchrum TaxID=637853 RepID=A0A183E5L1_9BILA|nr:unnamed protein product [Gongylonema pulchrum]